MNPLLKSDDDAYNEVKNLAKDHPLQLQKWLEPEPAAKKPKLQGSTKKAPPYVHKGKPISDGEDPAERRNALIEHFAKEIEDTQDLDFELDEIDKILLKTVGFGVLEKTEYDPRITYYELITAFWGVLKEGPTYIPVDRCHQAPFKPHKGKPAWYMYDTIQKGLIAVAVWEIIIGPSKEEKSRKPFKLSDFTADKVKYAFICNLTHFFLMFSKTGQITFAEVMDVNVYNFQTNTLKEKLLKGTYSNCYVLSRVYACKEHEKVCKGMNWGLFRMAMRICREFPKIIGHGVIKEDAIQYTKYILPCEETPQVWAYLASNYCWVEPLATEDFTDMTGVENVKLQYMTKLLEALGRAKQAASQARAAALAANAAGHAVA